MFTGATCADVGISGMQGRSTVKNSMRAALLGVLACLALPSAHAAMTCLPKPQWPASMAYGSVPTTVSTRFDTYAVWVCNTPTGYVANSGIFLLSDIIKSVMAYVGGKLALADVNADCAANCQAPTDAESAFLAQLVATNGPKALVAFNGATVTRSVYAANADGTLNPTPIAGSSVSVAAACNPGARLAGTPYFSVSGRPDASKPGQTLGAVYAVCVVSLPVGAN